MTNHDSKTPQACQSDPWLMPPDDALAGKRFESRDTDRPCSCCGLYIPIDPRDRT